MSAQVRQHIRSNVVGYVTLFLFLTSGTALALDGSDTVFSDDIVNGQVRSSDVQNNAVSAIDVADTSSLGTAEINEDDLFNDDSLAANDIASDAVGNAEVDGTLTGANIADTGGGTLHGVDIDESSLSKVPDADKLDGSDSVEYANQAAYARQEATCNPSSGTFVSCATVGITLPSASGVLVSANGGFSGAAVGVDDGRCQLHRDGSAVGAFSDPINIGQEGNEHSTNRTDGFSRTAIDVNVPAGAHTWQLVCNQDDGDLRIQDIQIVVMRLSG